MNLTALIRSDMKYVVIVAGGNGIRMGADVPKQFLCIGGRPVLMWTIEAFYNADKSITVILVLPPGQQSYWKKLCKKYCFSIPYILTDGGKTRYDSVKNGLSEVQGDGIVAVHDGVRPFVSADLINRCFDEAFIHGAVIPVVRLKESIRKVSEGSSCAEDRTVYRIVQTPQVFDASVLTEAYNMPYSANFTDDASVVESTGRKIFLIEGENDNIKITMPIDLVIAESIIKNK